jgi:hypothetical protein
VLKWEARRSAQDPRGAASQSVSVTRLGIGIGGDSDSEESEHERGAVIDVFLHTQDAMGGRLSLFECRF